MATGIFLTQRDLSMLSPQAQRELEQVLFGHRSSQSSGMASEAPPETSSEEIEEVDGSDEGGPADFSVAQVHKLINGCSDRPKAALRFIANQPSNVFSYNELVAELGNDSSGSIRGLLSAITRRTRTVLGDKGADFFLWEDDENEKWLGTVSAMTHSSLRKAMKIV